jgi:PIN domain nuclease of toxin-antitoxin system
MVTIVNVHAAKTNLSKLLERAQKGEEIVLAKAGVLDHHHRDPFDRTLAAQAMIEHMTLITSDPACEALGAETMW